MKFATLEEAQTAYDQLEPKVSTLESEKAALLAKRDELLGKLNTQKTKFAKFADYADQDIDIAALLDIKQRFESGDDAAKSKYEAAYKTDKEKFEARLRAIEEERQTEKQQSEKEKQETAAAKLRAEAIAEFSKESLRIRNPQQFWQLFGQGKIQRGEDGKLFVGDEYKKQAIVDYVAQINEDEDNAHHFKPRGGSGSGTGLNAGGKGGKVENPWARASINLTKQGQILKTNPELAARLKAEAGVK